MNIYNFQFYVLVTSGVRPALFRLFVNNKLSITF